MGTNSTGCTEWERDGYMPSFDAEKALKEEINGLVEIHTALKRRASQLQVQYGEIEIEYNSVMRLSGFAIAELDRKRAVLKMLEEQK